MEKQIIKIDPKEYHLEEKTSTEIEQAFKPKIEEREALIEVYKNVLTKELNEETCSEAKEIRLKLVKIRTGIASIHKTQKAYFLSAGKFCDAWKNKETLPVEQMEESLSKIEKHFENLELERLDNLQKERVDLILPYFEDAEDMEFSLMENDVWEAYFSTKKKQYEDRIEAEKKAEKERIAKEKAEAEERKRIAQENEQLKKDAEEKEKLRIKEENERQAKQEAERKIREEKERKQQAEFEAKLKAEREEREKIEREEKIRREKLQAELKAKQEAEEKAKKEQAEKEQAELNKGDEDKVKDLIDDLENLKIKYNFKSAKNKKMYLDVSVLIGKVISHIQS